MYAVGNPNDFVVNKQLKHHVRQSNVFLTIASMCGFSNCILFNCTEFSHLILKFSLFRCCLRQSYSVPLTVKTGFHMTPTMCLPLPVVFSTTHKHAYSVFSVTVKKSRSIFVRFKFWIVRDCDFVHTPRVVCVIAYV